MRWVFSPSSSVVGHKSERTYINSCQYCVVGNSWLTLDVFIWLLIWLLLIILDSWSIIKLFHLSTEYEMKDFKIQQSCRYSSMWHTWLRPSDALVGWLPMSTYKRAKKGFPNLESFPRSPYESPQNRAIQAYLTFTNRIECEERFRLSCTNTSGSQSVPLVGLVSVVQ